MKKTTKIALLVAATLSLGFASCSKQKSNQKEEFFTQLESIVKKAENNNLQEKIDEFKKEYDDFLKKYPKITSSSDWTAEDTEKMEDLQKRFSLSTVPMSDNSSYLLDDSMGTDDLGLDDSLNFGTDSTFGGLDISGLQDLGLGLDLNSSANPAFTPDINFDAILNDILSE
ncbi:MAG: hypothetical protein IKP60_09000 [Treponema sp.]|nr:hypothetical protein [Treponema sp.]